MQSELGVNKNIEIKGRLFAIGRSQIAVNIDGLFDRAKNCKKAKIE